MKNTLENKAKFFAQYWWQKVLKRPLSELIWDIGKEVSINSIIENGVYGYYLELKPLSQISDEDAIILANIMLGDVMKKYIISDTLDFYNIARKHGGIALEYKFKHEEEIGAKDGFYHSEVFISFHVTEYFKYIIVDKLRELGYALPWNGISVEEQIDFGWIKLKGL